MIRCYRREPQAAIMQTAYKVFALSVIYMNFPLRKP